MPTAWPLKTGGSPGSAGFRDVGMLIPGYHADFAVLSEDLLTTAPENIDKIRVEETYVDGELIYRNDKK